MERLKNDYSDQLCDGMCYTADVVIFGPQIADFEKIELNDFIVV